MKILKTSFIFLMTFLLVEGVSAFAGGDGSEGDPYQISTCQELQEMNDDLTAHYVLVDNINCGLMLQPFVSIGEYGTQYQGYFTGTLDGQTYSISNLQISRKWSGLFDTFGEGAVIQNINLVNPVVTVELEGGVLAWGSIDNGEITIENINVIEGTFNGGDGGDDEYNGGLIGRVGKYTNVINCHFEGSVFGAGGLVGQNDGHITGSSFSGTVDGSSVLTDTDADTPEPRPGLTGGLVGWNFGTITTSYSEGSVTGTNNVGGLVGGNEYWGDDYRGEISNSYSTADVTGETYYLGGFTGYNVGGDITSSYSTGTVTPTLTPSGEPVIFGLSLEMIFNLIDSVTNLEVEFPQGDPAGFLSYIDTERLIDGEPIKCEDSFWDVDTSELDGSDCDVSGKTTPQMKNKDTYINTEFNPDIITPWDFKDETNPEGTWDIIEGQYPHLSWEDSDNDGVLFRDDICPDTPLGEEALARGCSCDQILDLKPGEDTAENREGCSKGLISVFEKAIGWAQDI